MSPIHLHLTNNWRVPETLEKVIPIRRSLLSLKMVASGRTRSARPTIIPPQSCSLTDTSKERWGTHLGEPTARGTWSLPESKLHVKYLELKAIFLALKKFQDLWRGTHCKGNLVPSRKQTACKISGTKGDLSGPKEVPRPLLEPYSAHSCKQHHSGCYINKEGGG